MKLVLFDIDGTLLHGGGVGRAATREAMLEVFGTAATVDMHRFGGKTDWRTLVELLEPAGTPAADVARLMPAYEDALARHMGALIRSATVETLPGALDAVNHLRHSPHHMIGIVTGNVSTTAPIKLRAAGFDSDWFAVGAYGSESQDRADLPRLALDRARAASGRPLQAADVIVIGDTPADVDAAHALRDESGRAFSVAVLTGFADRAALQAASPDVILDDLTQLFTAVPL